jgi:hypothetical protein
MVMLSDRKLQIQRPRLREKNPGNGKEVEIPAYVSLAKLVQLKFGLNIHPRTIERAVAGKKLSDEQRHPQFAESSMVVARYEALRGAVLGEALPPESRTGLLLFLRRGMCGWARAVAPMCAPQRPTDSRPPNWTIAEEHRTVVQILASWSSMPIITEQYHE